MKIFAFLALFIGVNLVSKAFENALIVFNFFKPLALYTFLAIKPFITFTSWGTNIFHGLLMITAFNACVALFAVNHVFRAPVDALIAFDISVV